MSTWQVTKAQINGWEVGYCWIPMQEWLRIWIRRDGKSHTAHVEADGRIKFGASPWTVDAILMWVEAWSQREQYDPRLVRKPLDFSKDEPWDCENNCPLGAA